MTSFSSRFYLGNFKEGLSKIGRGLINSALIAFPAMLISTFVGSLAAYPLSQLKFKGDTAVYFLLLAGMYVPCQTVLIPLFFIIRRLGLYDTIPGLWLVHTAYGIPFTTLILRNFFAIVPSVVRPTLLYIWRSSPKYAPPERSRRKSLDFGCDFPGSL